jgi:hypothetical protein
MIRLLLRLAIPLLIGIVGYNYFFGTDTEKEQSRKIIGDVKALVGSVGSLVKSEKQQFDMGKYDEVLNKLGSAFGSIRSVSKQMSPKVLEELSRLEQRQGALQRELRGIGVEDEELAQMAAAASQRGARKEDPKAAKARSEKEGSQARRKEALQEEMAQLLKDAERLLQQAETGADAR